MREYRAVVRTPWFERVSRDADAVRPRHVRVGPVPIFDGSLEDAVGWLLTRRRLGQGCRVATANLDFVAQAKSNAELARDLNASHLVVADGMPVAWFAKMNGAKRARRIAGIDLMSELCSSLLGSPPPRVAIYGSTPTTSRKAAQVIEQRFGSRVVEVVNPPFRDLEGPERYRFRARLIDARPDLVLIALGCPRQERLIAEWSHDLPSAIWIGIGGSLDFLAGRRRRAPKLAQRVGMEWVVRLVQEPRRLGPRYLGRDLSALGGLAIVTARNRLRMWQRCASGKLRN